MAAGHREAARSVLDDGEHGATLDLAGVERSYSGRRRHRARSRRPLLPTQPIQAPNATHRFSGGTKKKGHAAQVAILTRTMDKPRFVALSARWMACRV